MNVVLILYTDIKLPKLCIYLVCTMNTNTTYSIHVYEEIFMHAEIIFFLYLQLFMSFMLEINYIISLQCPY